MSDRGRLPALDSIKAAAIVAVTLTHAVPGFFDSAMTDGSLFALFVTSFHVPAFLFVSGFLSHAEAPVGPRQVGERLSRILPPYFVATAVVWAFGLVLFPTPRKFVFKIVTGAAFGHYYFIPVLAFCFVLLPILSRLSNAALVALTLVLAAVAEALWTQPAWRPSPNLFWQVRDPLLQLHLGNFILGVLAARHRVALSRFFAGHPRVIAIGCGALLVGCTGFASGQALLTTGPVARSVYTLAVITFIAALTPARPVPAPVRFLSDATFAIYLYHWFACVAVKPYLPPLPLGLRMLLLSSLALGFGTLVVLAGRRLFGRWSRLLIGA